MSTENNGTFMRKHAKCQDGINCHGPGCRITTVKTARKKGLTTARMFWPSQDGLTGAYELACTEALKRAK